MQACVPAFALTSVLALASCATAPSTAPVQESPTAVATSNTGALGAEDASVLIRVNPSLRHAVLEAANQRPFLRGASFDSRASDSPAFTIVLRFASTVDRTRQRSNLEGTVAVGLPGLILGAVVPWACATSHTLSAAVFRGDGVEVLTEVVTEEENKVGTMLWCPDVTEPSAPMATKMAGALFVKLEQSGLFSTVAKP